MGCTKFARYSCEFTAAKGTVLLLNLVQLYLPGEGGRIGSMHLARCTQLLSDYSSTKFLNIVLIELITHQIVSFALRMHPETWIGQSDGLGSVSTHDVTRVTAVLNLA